MNSRIRCCHIILFLYNLDLVNALKLYETVGYIDKMCNIYLIFSYNCLESDKPDQTLNMFMNSGDFYDQKQGLSEVGACQMVVYMMYIL